ncbi:MAG TPA: bifunctional UDP-N-acetylglucosamine diphosphorylase/glucosamine-1-phosphate N-acetyltransferase GlmU [Rhizomicrobium sp.]|jgi:bifunctional UDP-N-acetylglucosamine pyrophosphorylase/glucosamine-1-phosphate N-acetyltransferase
MAQRAGIILAAGEGKRMKSALPKVMHTVAGLPILGHVIAAMREAGIDKIVVVTAAGGAAVRDCAASLGAESAIQEQQLGTGHAAACAEALLGRFDGALVVTYGDMPLVTPELFERSFETQANDGMAIVAFDSDSKAYGRVIEKDGILDRIVEYRDADERERGVRLCNAGIMAAEAKPFFHWASKLESNNNQREFYLTDVPTFAKQDGVRCGVVTVAEELAMGVNSRAELAACEAIMQRRLRVRALDNAVGMTAPETVFLSHDTVLQADCRVGPYVVFGPGVTVKSGAEIKAFTHLEGAVVESGAIVGPHARLRPGTVIESDAHIGNFVEVKNSRIGKGTKANHLAYLGDARVGEGANIGAGTITCNYDGFDKHETDIGAGVFIGSDTTLVAPVRIEDGAYIGAASTITHDVPKDALVFTRAVRKEKPGWAESFRARKKAEKAKKDK